MSVYYVDASSTNASDGNSGLSVDAPLASLDAVNRLALRPGDTVAFKAGTVYSVAADDDGALIISAPGTATAPITFTAYGAGAAPVINNTGSGYSDGIYLDGAKYVVIDGLKIGAAGNAAIDIAETTSHVTMRNVEATNVGEGVILNGTDNLVTRSYFHDLRMIANTPDVVGDDYGAVGVVIAASNNEVSFTRIENARAPSHDFGQDGGGFEITGTIANVRIHDNWVEGSEGFIEAGYYGDVMSGVSVTNNVSLNNGGFLDLHNSRGDHNTFTDWDVGHNTVVNQDNPDKDLATVFLDASARGTGLSFHDNAVYLSDGDSFFKQRGDYHADNVFYRVSDATHLYNDWSMALNAGERFAELEAVSGQTLVQEVAAQSGGAGATLTDPAQVGPVLEVAVTPVSDTHALQAAESAPVEVVASVPATSAPAVAIATATSSSTIPPVVDQGVMETGASAAPVGPTAQGADAPASVVPVSQMLHADSAASSATSATSAASAAPTMAASPSVAASPDGPTASTTLSVADQHAADAAHLYYGVLGRAPDADGLHAWAGALAGGTTLASVAQSFLASSEYAAASTGYTNAGVAAALYQGVLDRAGAPGEVGAWTAALDVGTVTRADLARVSVTSGEYQGHYAGQSDAAYVQGLYAHVLGRAGEASGVAGWVDALGHGLTRVALAGAFADGAEFQAKYVGPGDAAFVDGLYVHALGRHADGAASAAWTDALAHGMSRADVAVAISEGAEAHAHHPVMVDAGWHLA